MFFNTCPAVGALFGRHRPCDGFDGAEKGIGHDRQRLLGVMRQALPLFCKQFTLGHVEKQIGRIKDRYAHIPGYVVQGRDQAFTLGNGGAVGSETVDMGDQDKLAVADDIRDSIQIGADLVIALQERFAKGRVTFLAQTGLGDQLTVADDLSGRDFQDHDIRIDGRHIEQFGDRISRDQMQMVVRGFIPDAELIFDLLHRLGGGMEEPERACAHVPNATALGKNLAGTDDAAGADWHHIKHGTPF